MGSTAAEKILARAAGLPAVRAGEDIEAKPDFVLAYDFPNYTDVYFRQLEEDFGISRLKEPQRYAIFIDHLLENASPKQLEQQRQTRAWCERNGVPLYDRVGIGHQVAVEKGYATPGAFIVHFDGHISQLGTYGSLAIGLRRNVFAAFARETVAIRVPETVGVDFDGQLTPGVMARDVFNYVLRKLGPASCRFQVLEIGGPGTASLSLDGLQTITGLAMFTGALTAFVDLDAERLSAAVERARIPLAPVASDPDASYAARHTVDLGSIEPQVVVPPTPADVRDIRDIAGLPLQKGYLGSCVSGRLEDLETAARILAGKRIHHGFDLIVVPSSEEIRRQAQAMGYLAVLEAAGAQISQPTCDHCYGHLPLLGDGQSAISTGTLNVKGRMGSVRSDIYLGSAATVAASALEGQIADPRRFWSGNDDTSSR